MAMGVAGLAVMRSMSCPHSQSPLVRPFSPAKRHPLALSLFIQGLDLDHHPTLSLLSTRSSSRPAESVPEPTTSPLEDGFDDDDAKPEPEPEPEPEPDYGFEIEIEKVGQNRNRRRIRARIHVEAELETVWGVLTDYEGLAAFIPSLAVSQLLDKRDKFAKLYQVGQQDLALGLKFNAKGVLDCYERDLELIPSGRRRDIEFEMVEGDFQTFEGRWSIEQIDKEMYGDSEFISQEFRTTLSYVVELEPKLWLPVRLLEGRLCREVKTNLQCMREEAERVQRAGNEPLCPGGRWNCLSSDV